VTNNQYLFETPLWCSDGTPRDCWHYCILSLELAFMVIWISSMYSVLHRHYGMSIISLNLAPMIKRYITCIWLTPHPVSNELHKRLFTSSIKVQSKLTVVTPIQGWYINQSNVSLVSSNFHNHPPPPHPPVHMIPVTSSQKPNESNTSMTAVFRNVAQDLLNLVTKDCFKSTRWLNEISSSHGGECKVQICLLGCTAL
jgi:hypothetical protein